MRSEVVPIKDDGWWLSDDLWERIRVLLSPPKFHPWGMPDPDRLGCGWSQSS